MTRMGRRVLGVLGAAAVLLGGLGPAEAFCGFYVSGATGDLYSKATMTVMMRDGMRTVLAMRNDYQGPPEDFAMVIPVPVVLKKEDVKTLSPDLFAKVDGMAAPRLVEYWEQDPCGEEYGQAFGFGGFGLIGTGRGGGGSGFGSLGAVQVEARFEVEEYEIVILSAKESTALDAWLREAKYNIPKGAEAVLRPYVEGGMYFFVAKVDAKKVKFREGRAQLSPLRFHYDTKTFDLPVRLGLLNADGPQDLLVHIFAKGQRYEVANYPNATIPTNLDVAPEARRSFGGFYAALFDEVQRKTPGAVVTEYAWDASTCDPCPGPTLTASDLLSLGADVMPGRDTSGLVLTRLHARYDAASLREDLVFRAAGPLEGGREVYQHGTLERGAKEAERNNFQARYAIRHPWEGEITCDRYTRGRWGARPVKDGESQELQGTASPRAQAARGLAYAPRDGVKLASLLRTDLPELKVEAETRTRDLLGGGGRGAAAPAAPAAPVAEVGSVAEAESAAAPAAPVGSAPPAASVGVGCAAARGGSPGWLGGVLVLAGLVGLRLGRRRRV